MREELWINDQGVVSNFAILIVVVWGFVIGVTVGIAAVRRRPTLAEVRPGSLVLAAVLYGLLPAVLVAMIVGAVQTIVEQVV